MSPLNESSCESISPVSGAIAKERSPKRQAAYTDQKIALISQLKNLSPELVDSIKLAAIVFPFKVNDYALDNLIDWTAVPDDPMFRLLFPHSDMLGEENAYILAQLMRHGASRERIAQEAVAIRNRLNPHSSNQTANLPLFNGERLDGIQHKYEETVLFFPKQGQTCHCYCSFCFRWPQFVASDAIKFGSDDANLLHDYLRSKPGVTDLLITGGDPMVMNARRLRTYLEPLLAADLRHVTTIRIGTKALTYWPQRFFSEPDADDLMALISKLVDAGKHVAIMAHLNHWREMAPEPFEEAVQRLKLAGAVIRSQSPVIQHVNADSQTWRKLWTEQVRMGIIPYYMFMERDTGASHYFGIPVAQALSIYQDALAKVSGLAKTARGPVMSAGPGKVQILGTIEHGGQKHFVLTFLQARRREWLGQPFLAAYSETAQWLDELDSSDGRSSFFFEQQYADFLGSPLGSAVSIPARVREDGYHA